MSLLKYQIPVLAMFVFGSACVCAQSGNARKAINESGQASTNAVNSAGHGILASGQVTSAVVAVPLSVGGAVLGTAASVANGMANAALNAAAEPIGRPLLVTDHVITTMPPSEALTKERVN